MMLYIFLPSLGECGRLDTDNVSPEIANLIILSTSLHSTLVGALIRFIINKIPSLPLSHPSIISPQTRPQGNWLELPGKTWLTEELWLPVWNLEKYWQELQYSEQGLAITVSFLAATFHPSLAFPPRHTVIVIIWNCHVQYLSHKTKI